MDWFVWDVVVTDLQCEVMQPSFLTPNRCLTLCFCVTCDSAKYQFECKCLGSQKCNRLVFDMFLEKTIRVIFGANMIPFHVH